MIDGLCVAKIIVRFSLCMIRLLRNSTTSISKRYGYQLSGFNYRFVGRITGLWITNYNVNIWARVRSELFEGLHLSTLGSVFWLKHWVMFILNGLPDFRDHPTACRDSMTTARRHGVRKRSAGTLYIPGSSTDFSKLQPSFWIESIDFEHEMTDFLVPGETICSFIAYGKISSSRYSPHWWQVMGCQAA